MFRSHRLLEEKRRTAARLTSKETVCVSVFFQFPVIDYSLRCLFVGSGKDSQVVFTKKVLLGRKDVGKKKSACK